MVQLCRNVSLMKQDVPPRLDDECPDVFGTAPDGQNRLPAPTARSMLVARLSRTASMRELMAKVWEETDALDEPPLWVGQQHQQYWRCQQHRSTAGQR